MSEARERILARIRAGLGESAQTPGRSASVADRLAAHPRGTIPSRSAGGLAAHRALFERMVAAASASLENLATLAAVPRAVAAYLRGANLPATARIAPAPLLTDLDWTAAALQAAAGPAAASDTAGVSLAMAAIAETGTLMLASGPQSPTSLNFLPETHIVVVPASAIVAAYEDAFDLLRRAHGPGRMPRTVNLITGPSRTADIEQTLLMGAHGPKRLHVILVEDA